MKPINNRRFYGRPQGNIRQLNVEETGSECGSNEETMSLKTRIGEPWTRSERSKNRIQSKKNSKTGRYKCRRIMHGNRIWKQIKLNQIAGMSI